MKADPPAMAPADAAADPTPDPAAAATNGRRPPHSARPPGLALMLRDPVYAASVGFGLGLVPWAPGTWGTLGAWGAYALAAPALGETATVLLALLATVISPWVAARGASRIGQADPGAVVWDEVVAFWLVLIVAAPRGFWLQLIGFALFRALDALKPGPVGWADRAFKPPAGAAGSGLHGAWQRGFGIVLDDLVAAVLTMVALWALLLVWPGLGRAV